MTDGRVGRVDSSALVTPTNTPGRVARASARALLTPSTTPGRLGRSSLRTILSPTSAPARLGRLVASVLVKPSLSVGQVVQAPLMGWGIPVTAGNMNVDIDYFGQLIRSGPQPTVWIRWDNTLGEPIDEKGNTLALINTAAAGNPSLRGDGYGYSMVFDGSDDRLHIADAAWMDDLTQLSIFTIIQTTATGTRMIVSRDDSGAGGTRNYQFRYNAGKPEFVKVAGTVVTATPSSWINDGALHSIGVSYDGANIRLYQDGALVNTTAATGTLGTGTLQTMVGAMKNGGAYQNFHSGYIDETMIWAGTVLSNSQFASLHNTAMELPDDGANPALRYPPTITPVINSSSVPVWLPTGIESGDYIVMITGHGFQLTQVPTGFTSLGTPSGSNANGAIVYKVADGTEGGTSVTVSFTGSFYGEISTFIVKNAAGIRTSSQYREAFAMSGIGPPARSGTTGDLVLHGGYLRLTNGSLVVNRGTVAAQRFGDANAGGIALHEKLTKPTGVDPIYYQSGSPSGFHYGFVVMQGPNSLPTSGAGMYVTGGSGTSSVTKPVASMAVDDIVLMVVGSANSGLALPAGFTTAGSGAVSAGNYYAIGWKRIVSGDLVAGSWTPTSSLATGYAIYRGSQDPTFSSPSMLGSVNWTHANFPSYSDQSGQFVRIIRTATNSSAVPAFSGYATSRVSAQGGSWGVGIADWIAGSYGVPACSASWTETADWVHMTAKLLPV